MKMNKKGQVLENLQSFIMSIVVIGAILAMGLFVLAQISTAVTTQSYTDTAYSVNRATGQLNISSAMSLAFGENAAFHSLTNVTPNATVKIEINQTSVKWLITEWYFSYRGTVNTTINLSEVAAYSNRTGLIPSTNYTVFNVSGDVIIFNLTNSSYSGDNITILYNRTFRTSDNLVGSALCYDVNCGVTETGATDSFGTTHTLLLTKPRFTNGAEFAAMNFKVNYYERTRLPNGDGAGTATDEMIDKIATTPVWIGLLIVVIFAMAILSYFYYRKD